MKIYLSYKFTGEKRTVLKTDLSTIIHTLEAADHTVFCAFQQEGLFQQHHYTAKQIIDSSLPHLRAADILLAYIKSNDKSEGMLLEIGYAYALKKPIYAAIKQGVATRFISTIANQVIRYKSLKQLQGQLSTLSSPI
jgi:nucleoside 2-deoxyribosyltransferase